MLPIQVRILVGTVNRKVDNRLDAGFAEVIGGLVEIRTIGPVSGGLPPAVVRPMNVEADFAVTVGHREYFLTDALRVPVVAPLRARTPIAGRRHAGEVSRPCVLPQVSVLPIHQSVAHVVQVALKRHQKRRWHCDAVTRREQLREVCNP